MFSKIRSLASDTFFYGVFTTVGRFLNFIIIPIYTNYLTKAELGDISLIASLLAFVNIVYTFGMENAFFRFYSKNDNLKSRIVFSHSFFIIALISGTASIIIFMMSEAIAPNITRLESNIEIIRVVAFIPFFDALMIVPFALLRMKRNIKRFALTRFLVIILNVSLNLILVIGFHWVVVGFYAANLIASLFGVLILSDIIKLNLTFKIDIKLLKEMLRFGIPTVPASFAAIVLQTADKPILKALTDASQLGVYSVNYKLAIPMMMFVSIFEYAWRPFYLSHYEETDAKQVFARVFTYFVLVCALLFLFISLFIEYIVMMPFVGGRFVNPDYWEGLGIVQIILGGYFFNGVFTNFAAGVNIAKKTEYFPIAIGISAVVYLVLNFTLVPLIGYWGSAYSNLFSYFISALLLFLFSYKVYPILYEWKRILILFSIALSVYIVSSLVSSCIDLYYALFIKLISLTLFIVILFLSGFFTKSEINRIKSLLVKTDFK
jgi:O-antigen/teichoic acid export membrane protein